MNKNKVFLLVEKWQFHGDENLSIGVYETYEKAKEKFDEIIEKEKEHLNNNKTEDELQELLIEEEEHYFLYYKDGFYTEENYTLSIEKREII